MATQTYVNLPVKDLDRTTEFFTRLGFKFDPRFSNEKAACMVVSDDSFVMLLTEDFFRGFTKKQITDPTTHTEVIIALSAETREAVDRLVDTALANGGTPSNEPMEMDGMYERSFQDPDGHLWEVLHMDPFAVPSP
ncbi:MAG: VOC family protein [Actinomycetota bacterium]